MHKLEKPYLVFLGDVQNPLDAKTGVGVAKWRPEWCVGQLRLPGCAADAFLPDMDIDEAVRQGARTLLVGVSPTGGVLKPEWDAVIERSLEAGLHLASGLHQKLAEVESFCEIADRMGVNIHDVRHTDQAISCGTGKSRSGRRILTVGTDTCVGKKYTALTVARLLRELGLDAEYKATGQTGIFIAESGVAIDCIVSDFVSGAVEWLSPSAADSHWDVIEGQGSIYHPAFAGVTVGLVHGAQPDYMILCHEAGRTVNMDNAAIRLPSLNTCVEDYTRVAQLTNPGAMFIGVSINTSNLSEDERDDYLNRVKEETNLPCFDPLREGPEAALQYMFDTQTTNKAAVV